MIESVWVLLGIGALVVAAIMFGLWRLGIRNHNFSYVDIGWSGNFAVLALLYAGLAPGYPPRRVLIASMFALQWVTTKMSGMEQNSQTRMMMYTMPLMMGIFFWWMPSGLNLYYATTNVASLPQQVLLARERRRATEAQKAKDAPAKKKPGAPARPPAREKRRT